MLLGSTAFDGLSRTLWWQGLSGRTSGVAYVLLGTVGLLGMIALVTGAYLAATRQNPWARRGQQVPVERRFVHSLLPIAVGYTVAHYFSLVVGDEDADHVAAEDGAHLDKRDHRGGDDQVVDLGPDGPEQVPAAAQRVGGEQVAGLALEPVSYTHLTLPTKRIV